MPKPKFQSFRDVVLHVQKYPPQHADDDGQGSNEIRGLKCREEISSKQGSGEYDAAAKDKAESNNEKKG